MKSVLCLAVLGIVSSITVQSTQDVKNKDVPEFLRQLADTRKTIADNYMRWIEAVKSKNVDALVGMYSDDATVLPEGKDAVSGKTALRAFYSDWLAGQDKLVDQKFENINSVQEGDLLIDSTKVTGVVVRDGKEIPVKGKRLIVWKRELQGPWKIFRDTWNNTTAQ